MCKPTCNGVKMCKEEKGVYLKTATYILVYTNVRYSASCVINDPSMSSCGWCKTIITHAYDIALPQIQRNQIWWKHEHYDCDPCLETLSLTGSTELTTHFWWIKFVKEMLLVPTFIIRIQSILNVGNNTSFKQELSFYFLSVYILYLHV